MSQALFPGIEVRTRPTWKARCLRCGHPLRSKNSVRTGMGPACRAKSGLQIKRSTRARRLKR